MLGPTHEPWNLWDLQDLLKTFQAMLIYSLSIELLSIFFILRNFNRCWWRRNLENWSVVWGRQVKGPRTWQLGVSQLCNHGPMFSSMIQEQKIRLPDQSDLSLCSLLYIAVGPWFFLSHMCVLRVRSGNEIGGGSRKSFTRRQRRKRSSILHSLQRQNWSCSSVHQLPLCKITSFPKLECTVQSLCSI